MRALRLSVPARVAGLTAVAALLVGGASAPAALAHGGTTVVEGSSNGVTVLVQRAEAQTASGGPAADISTVLGGAGTGKATVDYWIRPGAGKTFKVETERDEGGTYHADISTSGRGDAASWDVSAIVTLGDGKRLRVSTDPGNAPGPDPKQATPTPPAEDETEAPTSPTLSEGNPPTPTATSPAAAGDDGAVDDISGESDGPPAWAFPSFLVLTIIGFAILALRRRKLLAQRPDHDQG